MKFRIINTRDGRYQAQFKCLFFWVNLQLVSANCRHIFDPVNSYEEATELIECYKNFINFKNKVCTSNIDFPNVHIKLNKFKYTNDFDYWWV